MSLPRLFTKVKGVDTNFRFLIRDSDLDQTLTGLTQAALIPRRARPLA